VKNEIRKENATVLGQIFPRNLGKILNFLPSSTQEQVFFYSILHLTVDRILFYQIFGQAGRLPHKKK
jgi:hypothetical protein